MTVIPSGVSARISFANLQAQLQTLEPELSLAMRRVVEAGCFILGPETRAFEAEFAAFCGIEHCVGCASGSDALQLSLQGLGVGAGDEVLVPAFTFFATAQAVVGAGARPVFVDVEPSTGLIDPEAMQSRVTPRTKAIVPVHLFGQIADMEHVLAVARRHDLLVVEDAAQAHGATRAGQRAGTFGDAAAFSFYPGKNLGAYGDAGAIVTRSPELDRWLRMARQHGSKRKFEHHFVGRNSRLDELQAAVLRVKLRRLEDWTHRRRAIADRYDEALSSASAVRPLHCDPGSARHLYVVRVGDRDQVAQAMRNAGVDCAIHYPSLVPRQPALRHLDEAARSYPGGESLCRDVLSLPLHPELSDSEVDYVAATLIANAG